MAGTSIYMDEVIHTKDLENKHLLSIDYGRKFTGIATYKYDNDPYPIPWGRIPYKSDQQLITDIQQIISDELIDIVILGIPHFTDGKESTMTKSVKAFAQQLSNSIESKLYLVDETLTTFEAKERMENDPRYNFQVDMKKIDELCAVIILEQFLKNSSD